MTSGSLHSAAIGIGSNLGDSVRICLDAIGLLQKHPSIHILRVSSLYRTKPVGVTGQDWYVNAAVVCKTSFEPLQLLELALGMEHSFGRVRTAHWGPRTLDLDILYYDNLLLDIPGLKVPHPLMHERLFVLAPLAEIDPDWVHPGSGLSIASLLNRVLQLHPEQELHKLE
ncbi:MAG: 2-amino-4-hydroxy-6-hydroxymethyldihydropteridine diphosphokinase [Syntrophobacteraceae bacterium]